jgi:hypothetical protein
VPSEPAAAVPDVVAAVPAPADPTADPIDAALAAVSAG